VQIKRDMEQGRDEVRVMTVHGAKGLEAEIVFIVDASTPKSWQHDPDLLALHVPRGAQGRGPALVWPVSKTLDVPPVQAARDDAARLRGEEERRLLYVAMTRARDRLYLCGFKGEKEAAHPWVPLVEAALEGRPHARRVEDPHGFGFDVLRLAEFDDEAGPGATETAGPDREELPDWARRRIAFDAAPPRYAAPSSAWIAGANAQAPVAPLPDPLASGESRRAFERGRIVHRLLELLPETPPEERADAATRFLEQQAPDFPPAQRARLAAECLAIVSSPRFAALFGERSRAEVAVVGLIELGEGGEPLRVSGVIDRLAVTDKGVLIADYKTDRRVPQAPEDVPEQYLVQMAIYARVVERIFPGRPILPLLIFTAGPKPIPLDPQALAPLVERLGAAS
jgi:ATP-dependent helicase/nuclease subunit A